MGDEEREDSKITLRLGLGYCWVDDGAIYLEHKDWGRGIKSAVLSMLSLKYLLDIQM